ncbi:MAG: hypothetical protein KOO63_07900 [Bacteroidales bacterium]|nr:hypothetical protein [Candidatus Latescibacterota bacterium]
MLTGREFFGDILLGISAYIVVGLLAYASIQTFAADPNWWLGATTTARDVLLSVFLWPILGGMAAVISIAWLYTMSAPVHVMLGYTALAALPITGLLLCFGMPELRMPKCLIPKAETERVEHPSVLNLPTHRPEYREIDAYLGQSFEEQLHPPSEGF